MLKLYYEPMLSFQLLLNKMNKGSSINDVTVSGEGEGLGFFDNSTRAKVIKSVTTGVGVSRIIKNYVTSFMDDP